MEADKRALTDALLFWQTVAVGMDERKSRYRSEILQSIAELSATV